MTLRLHNDPETTGRLLHQQLLAEARREVPAWDEDPQPLRVQPPVPVPVQAAGPSTEPMRALPGGKHRLSGVVRLRPRGLAILAAFTAAMAHLADYTDTAAGLLT